MIVGLSNPKIQYHNTRHNVGSWYIHCLVKKCANFLVEDKKFLGFSTCINIASKNIRIFIPDIFMNINGSAIYKIAVFYKIDLNEILVVHDDLDLDPGIMRCKYSYGHGGHNGLRSVVNVFNKKINFYRFRIGIGRPKNKNEISSFVLSPPSDAEMILIKKSILFAVEKTFILFKLNSY